MPSREVEIKFTIVDRRVLARKLRAGGFRVVHTRTHEFNTLYDLITPQGGELRSRGELLRLRKYGSDWVLTFKGKAEFTKHKSRIEQEVNVSDGAVMDKILRSLGFVPTFQYEKYRTVWSDGRGHVMVDETPIGDIGEIESTAKWIDRTAKRLGISQADYSTASYATLFFDWKKRTENKAMNMTWKAMGMKRK